MPCLRLLPPPMLSTPLPRIVLQSDPCIGEEGAQPTIHGLVLETTGLAEREERRRGSSCSFGRLVSARGFLIASCPLLSSPALTQRRLPPPFASVTFIPFNSFSPCPSHNQNRILVAQLEQRTSVFPAQRREQERQHIARTEIILTFFVSRPFRPG